MKSYQIRFAIIGCLIVPLFMRINIHGKGVAIEPTLFVIPLFVGGFAGFLIGRMKDKWLKLNSELEVLVEKRTEELQIALREVKTLRGILPLCSYCKKIRNDTGFWERVETYIHNHSEADITHSICPECMQRHFPDIDKDLGHDGKNQPASCGPDT